MDKNVTTKILTRDIKDVLLGDKTPLVSYSKLQKDTYHNHVNILAFIPTEVEDILIKGPSAVVEINTLIGVMKSRVIVIRWEKDVAPDKGPHNLWEIEVKYNEHFTKESVIMVQYEYGDPELSRGTVTTSGSPVS